MSRLDSFKGHSALGSIITSTFSQLRRIILELLLLSGAEAESEDDLEVAMEKNNVEVVEILLTWTTSGREAGKSSPLFTLYDTLRATTH